jgi:IclR family KDG regulon transcriptional repressor
MAATRHYGELQSAARAARVLLAFTRAEQWNAASLARELGLHRSVVHRLLLTLTTSGLLVRDESTSAYSLAPVVARLRHQAESEKGLVRMTRPHLEALWRQSGETVALCVLRGDQGLCVDVVESRQSMRFTVHPGEMFPLNAGCIGKTILAFQPADTIERLLARGPLMRFTENTIVEPAALVAELEGIRKAGVGFSDAEITPGARSVGAPVFNADGSVSASVVISAPSFRMGDAELPRFFAMVRSAADALSRNLGFKAQAPGSRPRSSREISDHAV